NAGSAHYLISGVINLTAGNLTLSLACSGSVMPTSWAGLRTADAFSSGGGTFNFNAGASITGSGGTLAVSGVTVNLGIDLDDANRSEERRIGKERRAGRPTNHPGNK